MFALLFPEPGHGAAQAVLPCSKHKKTGQRMSKQKKTAECVL